MGEPPTFSESGQPREPRGRWTTLFQRSTVPVFLLSRRRQLRYVNPAWERLTGKSGELLRGQFCLPRKSQGTLAVRALLQTLSPPTEAMEMRTVTIRRPVPAAKLGPPWWEITFVPIDENGSLSALVGFIRPIEPGETESPPPGLSEAMMALRLQAASRNTFEQIAGGSRDARRLIAQARLASRCRDAVWIIGESGVGKETLARAIHFQGVTREQTFVGIDSAGLQPYLIRAMLFGRTGQATSQLGTVYLKDASALPHDLQAEISDWAAELESPPRIVVGVREDGRQSRNFVESFETTFRVLEIHISPLRQRSSDLPAVIESIRQSRGLPDIHPAALDALLRHDWPGNFRELDAVLRGAASATNGGRIEIGHLPVALRVGDCPHPRSTPPLDALLEQVERRMLALALQKAKGNKSEAAEQLGIPRARLLRRLEVLGLTTTE